eukprot:3958610-Prymnesium_polylepis.3
MKFFVSSTRVSSSTSLSQVRMVSGSSSDEVTVRREVSQKYCAAPPMKNGVREPAAVRVARPLTKAEFGADPRASDTSVRADIVGSQPCLASLPGSEASLSPDGTNTRFHRCTHARLARFQWVMNRLAIRWDMCAAEAPSAPRAITMRTSTCCCRLEFDDCHLNTPPNGHSAKPPAMSAPNPPAEASGCHSSTTWLSEPTKAVNCGVSVVGLSANENALAACERRSSTTSAASGEASTNVEPLTAPFFVRMNAR